MSGHINYQFSNNVTHGRERNLMYQISNSSGPYNSANVFPTPVMTVPFARINFQPLFVNNIMRWQDYPPFVQAPSLQAQSYFHVDQPDSVNSEMKPVCIPDSISADCMGYPEWFTPTPPTSELRKTVDQDGKQKETEEATKSDTEVCVKSEVKNEAFSPVGFPQHSYEEQSEGRGSTDVATSNKSCDADEAYESSNDSGISTGDSQRDKQGAFLEKNVQHLMLKMLNVYQMLQFRLWYSQSFYQNMIGECVKETHSIFCMLESLAVRDILKFFDWSSVDTVSEAFDHKLMVFADNLAVSLLQLILAYYNAGIVSVDETDPRSMAVFYRGEFHIGRMFPGKYLIHVTSYQYTTFTCFANTKICSLDMCTARGDGFVATDGENITPKSFSCSEKYDGNELSNSLFLKVYRWHVKFLQNPDLEDEYYFLCCKALRSRYHQPEYILQSETAEYYFGKWLSPRMNFDNPDIEEIEMSCRPSGKFQILHTLGKLLPQYSTAVGVLVDYLRHRRFRRTIF